MIETILVVGLILLALAMIVGNNFDKKQYSALVADLLSKLPTSLGGGVTVNHAPVTLTAAPPVIQQATPDQINAVPPVALDPATAITLTQVQAANLGYVSYLNALGAKIADWQSTFVTAAAALAATGSGAGALVWCPSQGKALAINTDAQVVLIILRNLGAAGLITGSSPNQ